jgi:hypothetical protein
MKYDFWLVALVNASYLVNTELAKQRSGESSIENPGVVCLERSRK